MLAKFYKNNFTVSIRWDIEIDPAPYICLVFVRLVSMMKNLFWKLELRESIRIYYLIIN